MGHKSLESIEHSQRIANMTMGIGILFTVVPIGLCLVSWLTASTKSPSAAMDALFNMGLAFYVTLGLLPLGLALFVGAFGWMVALDKAHRELEEELEDEEEDDDEYDDDEDEEDDDDEDGDEDDDE